MHETIDYMVKSVIIFELNNDVLLSMSGYFEHIQCTNNIIVFLQICHIAVQCYE